MVLALCPFRRLPVWLCQRVRQQLLHELLRIGSGRQAVLHDVLLQLFLRN